MTQCAKIIAGFMTNFGKVFYKTFTDVFIIFFHDRPTCRPTDLAFCKILNGHISATGHPIHFMFGSTVGFSRSADRKDLLPVGPNPRWRLAAILENFE